MTYLGWNGTLNQQYEWFLHGAADYLAAIAQFFGGNTVAGPPPDKLLKDEYPEQLARWEQFYAVPFCNAVTVEYLCGGVRRLVLVSVRWRMRPCSQR